MPKKKAQLDRFSDLTWNDIEKWAGGKIVSRGKSYQRQGRVSDLAVTDDGGLVAWVGGTKRYATQVAMGEDGLLESICSCPYGFTCKHAVAVVIEYLKHIEENRRVPTAKPSDERLEMLEEIWDDEPDEDESGTSEDMRQDFVGFLRGKTKAQLVELIHELAGQHPEIAQNLSDRQQVISGNIKTLVTRLRHEIRNVGDEPGWQDYWKGEGYTPDYSGIRVKLDTLLKAGHADEVLALGRELVTTGNRQVEQSHDEGETAMELADCMPVIVEALDQSSLDPADKLNWALDVVLADQFDVFGSFAEYLYRIHPKTSWHTLADRLLAQLKGLVGKKRGANYSRDFERDQISNWTIHALDQAGRKDEIIPLCVAEAERTGSYDRLVKELMEAQRYEDAEKWIKKGIRSIDGKWPGIASSLREKLREIRTQQKNWPVVAAMQTEEFVRHPSRQAFMLCKKAADKMKTWPEVRAHLLQYLETGDLPWRQEGWPLPESGLDRPGADRRNRFPMIDDLIGIAILEKKPDRVLHWYDQRPKERYGRYGSNEDEIATTVKDHAPERAAGIWKNKAEGLIALTKPSAYLEAVKYLRKAQAVMTRVKKEAAWEQYLEDLRAAHARKRRLLEILDSMEDKPIVKKKR